MPRTIPFLEIECLYNHLHSERVEASTVLRVGLRGMALELRHGGAS